MVATLGRDVDVTGDAPTSVMSPPAVRTFRVDVRLVTITSPPLVSMSTAPLMPATFTVLPSPTMRTRTPAGTATRCCTSHSQEPPSQWAWMTSDPPTTSTFMSGLATVHSARRLTCTSSPSAGTTTTRPASLSHHHLARQARERQHVVLVASQGHVRDEQERDTAQHCRNRDRPARGELPDFALGGRGAHASIVTVTSRRDG